MTVSMVARIASDGLSAMESEDDLWIAKESIVPLTKVMEVFDKGNPRNRRFSSLMAEVYGNVAFGFFEPRHMAAPDEEKGVWLQRMKKYYSRGYESGMDSLKKRFGKSVVGPIAGFEKAISRARRKDIRLLFWTAFNLINLINLSRDDIKSIADLPKASVMIDRVIELKRDFGCGSALAFKGALLASRPKMLGGNPEEAVKFFEEAINIKDGKYLMTKVMYAEWYAIPMGHKVFAKKLLNDVIGSDVSDFPEQALANNLAKERAGILLKRM